LFLFLCLFDSFKEYPFISNLIISYCSLARTFLKIFSLSNSFFATGVFYSKSRNCDYSESVLFSQSQSTVSSALF